MSKLPTYAVFMIVNFCCASVTTSYEVNKLLTKDQITKSIYMGLPSKRTVTTLRETWYTNQLSLRPHVLLNMTLRAHNFLLIYHSNIPPPRSNQIYHVILLLSQLWEHIGGPEVQPQSFFISALDGSSWWHHVPVVLLPENNPEHEVGWASETS